jgi:serine protease Do
MPSLDTITQILPDSCAEAAGLRTGDILLCLNGSSITDLSILQTFFDSCTPGGTVSFTVYRNGETITISFLFPEMDH